MRLRIAGLTFAVGQVALAVAITTSCARLSGLSDFELSNENAPVGTDASSDTAAADTAADSSVDSADSSVDSADSSVDSADSSVDSADSKADSADSKADSADSKADSADSSADSADSSPPSQSCKGILDCGGLSCCQSISMTGGTFKMGRATTGSDACPTSTLCPGDEQPEHQTIVASFGLDMFEVTVGRFRNFVGGFNGSPPAAGAAAHPLIAGSGWDSAWNANLPKTKAELLSLLKCEPTRQTWTDEAGTNENYPIVCVNWYEAFAFCAWDGGRLPTEAEWEYAAAGGNEERLYPWGAAASTCKLANFADCGIVVNEVGIHETGNGKWGHRDLAGNVYEWALDWFANYPGTTCTNCANLTPGTEHVARGGAYGGGAGANRGASRIQKKTPDFHGSGIGFRCAKTP